MCPTHRKRPPATGYNPLGLCAECLAKYRAHIPVSQSEPGTLVMDLVKVADQEARWRDGLRGENQAERTGWTTAVEEVWPWRRK